MNNGAAMGTLLRELAGFARYLVMGVSDLALRDVGAFTRSAS